MAEVKPPKRWRLNRHTVEHSGRTALAALASFLVANCVPFAEPYWAVIMTLIIMQSTLGAAWAVSRERFFGTALGAAMGALLGNINGGAHDGSSIALFTAGVFTLGMICAALGLNYSYRFAGITLAIVMLITRSEKMHVIALHRFIEVCIGIIVGLAVTAIWPEREPST